VGLVIPVRVTPRASRPGIAGWRDKVLLVRLSAPPVGGAANDELVEVIAKALDLPKRAVTIVSGERGRQKRVRVVGIDESLASARLGMNVNAGMDRAR
jgi:uncharacterized protein (TIGR00251 family)